MCDGTAKIVIIGECGSAVRFVGDFQEVVDRAAARRGDGEDVILDFPVVRRAD